MTYRDLRNLLVEMNETELDEDITCLINMDDREDVVVYVERLDNKNNLLLEWL